MTPLKTDLSIWNKLELEVPPVGVKFLIEKAPQRFKRIDGKYTLCEMIKVAQFSSEPFFMSSEDECCVGGNVLGMSDWTPEAKSGQLGVNLGIFQDGRCNSRMYNDLPKLMQGTVNSVVFAPLEKIDFDPDLMFVLAQPAKAEIILRAMTYSTGERYISQYQPVMACAYLYAYPMLSGKVNFVMTGLSFGMKVFEVFKSGQVLMSIPYQWIPTITHNLSEIQWVLPAYTMGREKYNEYFTRLMENE